MVALEAHILIELTHNHPRTAQSHVKFSMSIPRSQQNADQQTFRTCPVMHGQAHMWCLSIQVEQTARQRIKTPANEELREAGIKHRTAEPRDEETLSSTYPQQNENDKIIVSLSNNVTLEHGNVLIHFIHC